MFDFNRAIASARKNTAKNNLFLILLGSSGNGKSYAMGTFGVKTLYLYTQVESHGPKTALLQGGENLIPICIDQDEDGHQISADAALAQLHAILDDEEGLRKLGIQAIALDGLSELEALIRNSTGFRANRKSSFDEGPLTLAGMREIVNKLKKLQNNIDVHVCTSCILNVKEFGDSGEIIDSMPSLAGYNVATGVVQMFDDVMVIGRMQKGTKVDYRLQLLAGVVKTTKDFTTNEVKKTFNFSPRLLGVDITQAPSTLKADLSELIQMKKDAGKTVLKSKRLDTKETK